MCKVCVVDEDRHDVEIGGVGRGRGYGQGQGQGCQMVIMCQELLLSRLSIEMTGSRTDAATNLNWMA